MDSKRRDFSINAMYYFSVEQKTKKELDFVHESPKIVSEIELVKILGKNGYCYLSDINLLIITDHQFVQQVFPQSHFDEYCFRYLIETQNECYCVSDNMTKESNKLFRVLIDPT